MSTGGAGQRALDRAFEELFGIARAFAGIELAGRTDPLILADALARHGVGDLHDHFPVFRERYVAHLADEMQIARPGRRALPGVHALLDQLETRGDAVLGLLTGNLQPSAQLKLEPFGLWRYFSCGAFGDDAEDRNGLVPVALSRASGCGHEGLTSERTVVIGDTPRDVACAAAAGAWSLAVATGGFAADDLRAAGAHAVLKDLSDTVEVESVLKRLLEH